jgi:MoxR-like ATPase
LQNRFTLKFGKENIMNNWYIFKGDPKNPHDSEIPPAPVWRRFSATAEESGKSAEDTTGKAWDEIRGKNFKADEEMIRMVNAALYLRRPLLVTGKPGTGKSSLAYSVAQELNLGRVLYWPITTRSTLQEGLYRYDAVGRLQDLQMLRLEQPQGKIEPPDMGQYIRLGPLGTAFLPRKKPRVLLIDEIDKSDIDLPNDLLNIFEEGRFEIPELSRLPEKYREEVDVFVHDTSEKAPVPRGRVVCDEFPLVILTSNAERELPAPFLRRCLRLDVKKPGKKKLEEIVRDYFENEKIAETELDKLISTFIEMREKGDLATDQLLNAIYLTTRGIDLSSDVGDIGKLRDAIFQYLSAKRTIQAS